jgi:hypothetical protein
MDLTGCGPLEAATALAEHKEIWRAVDALLPTPVEAGAAYIPPRPVVDSGLSPEQAARCAKGRWLQDQINVVFSVAHSKTRSPLDDLPSAPESSQPLEDQQVSVPVESAGTHESLPGSVE